MKVKISENHYSEEDPDLSRPSFHSAAQFDSDLEASIHLNAINRTKPTFKTNSTPAQLTVDDKTRSTVGLPLDKSFSGGTFVDFLRELHYLPLIFAVACFFCLFPIMLGMDFHLKGTTLSHALSSSAFTHMMAGTLALTAPITLDLLLEMFMSSQWMFEFNRVSAIVALLVPSFIFFYIERLSSPEAIFVSLRYWQILVWNGMAMTALMINCPKVFTGARLYVVSFFLFADVFSDLYGLMKQDSAARVISQGARHTYYTIAFGITCMYAHHFYQQHSNLFAAFSFRELARTLSNEEYKIISVLAAW